MEFFEDEPTSPREREPKRAGQTVLLRRAVAIGALLIAFLLVVLGIRGCLESRKDRAVKNYVANNSELVKESASIGEDFFALLRKPGKATPLDLKKQINQDKATSKQLVERAKRIDPPGDLKQANQWLISSLELREQALAEIARLLPGAFGDKGSREASERIAGQMQAFLASDVVYLLRFVPDVREELKKRGLDDETKVPEARFMNDITWLEPDTIVDRLGAVKGEKTATPGLHGVGLVKVTAQPSGTELAEGETTTIEVSSKLAFAIEIQNQGDSEETDVAVRVKVPGPEGEDLENTVRRVGQGETKTVTIPFTAKPPSGPNTLEVRVEPVPGEKVTDNNKADYAVEFKS